MPAVVEGVATCQQSHTIGGSQVHPSKDSHTPECGMDPPSIQCHASKQMTASNTFDRAPASRRENHARPGAKQGYLWRLAKKMVHSMRQLWIVAPPGAFPISWTVTT